jgi:hypothetical protein
MGRLNKVEVSHIDATIKEIDQIYSCAEEDTTEELNGITMEIEDVLYQSA